MKTTLELYGIDPLIFGDMLYKDVLKLKRNAAESIYKEAAMEEIRIGFRPLSKEELNEVSQLQTTMKEATKALKYITLWETEAGLHESQSI